MNHSKPDLLLVLMMILGLGVWMTSYGAPIFKGWDVYASTHLVAR